MMNNLQHIRSMAEMIIKQVNELEGAKHEVKLRKFTVGQPVYYINGCGDEVQETIVDVHQYDLDRYAVGSNGVYNCWMSESLLSGTPRSKPEPKFKVGDKVFWDTGWGCDNEKYTVTSVTKNETLGDNGVVRYTYDISRFSQFHHLYGDISENELKPHVEPKDAERIWHDGSPPHVGWWNASFHFVKGKDEWRWWDGERWSIVVDCYNSNINLVRMCAETKIEKHYGKQIQWTDYWPENARVPRINPYFHHKDVYMVEGDKVWYGHPNASWVGFWHLDPKTGNVTKVD